MTRIFLVLCVILLLVCPMAFAQNLGTGLYAFGSFDSRGFDSINIGNLNTHFEIPIVNKPGRGLPFGYTLVYDGLIWSPSTTTGTETWVPDSAWGFRGQLFGAITGFVSYASSQISCPPVQGQTGHPIGFRYNNFVYHDQFGRNHAFNYTEQGCPQSGPPTYGGDGSTSDGSGFHFVSFNGSNQASILTLSGSTIITPVQNNGQNLGSITDSNGNVITNNGNGTFTDTTGKIALTVGGSGTPASPTTFTYPVVEQASGASTAAATLAYKAYTVQTNFQCPGITEFGATSVNLVDHLSLVDGSTYSFTYEKTPGASGAVTGRLALITLPTGGTIAYTYIDGGCGGSGGSGINGDGTPGSLVRATSDGTRTYTRFPINGNATGTTLQDEKANQSKYQFTIIDGLFYETHRQIYQGLVGNNLLLEDVYRCYNGVAPPCDGAAMTLPISQTNSLTSYNGGAQLGTTNVYDAAGGLTSSTQMSGSTQLQKTTYSYNSLEEVASVSQFDGNNTAYAFTYYGFDESTPTATSGIASHVAVSGTRGNVTSSHVSVGGSYLTTTTAYYDTGVPVSTTTPNGKTSYGYDQTQTFVTSTTLPTPSSGVSLATSATYDASSGAQLTSSGFNTNQTTYYAQYDSRLRPTIINPPTGSGQVTISYSPTQIGINPGVGSIQTLLDAYGRKSRVAVANGQSTNGWYQVDYCYDATGLLQFQTTRYQANGFATAKQCSGSGTSYVYDALGRVTSTTTPDGTASNQYHDRAVESTDVNGAQKITQYDLLGRISGVCEISSNNSMPGSGSPAACNMDIAGTGFSTSYTYNLAANSTTITQGAQTRSVTTDPGGRVTSVVEPERGTTTYGYIYNSTGLQVTRTRPKANQTSATVTTTTTTQYDSLGRPVGVVYNDPLTPTKTFAYDSAGSYWSNGSSATNLKGQLAVIGGSNTGALFSYDLEGHVISMWQCAPSTCGNSTSQLSRPPITLSYDGVGNLTSEGDGVSGTIAYGRSPAGEVTSITNQTYTGMYNPANLVSSVVNGAYGPVSYRLGNGLSVNKTYDSLGRVTGSFLCQGSMAVSCSGGTQVYGFTAHQTGVRLTNSCDTAVSQCLNYGYDDFNRLTSQSGTTSLSYVYDRWGNRTSQTLTQGGPAPSPSYTFNTSTNQIKNQGFIYDAAGNMINDTSHTYTYDAEGNLLTVDGGSTATYVYDALNRRVRQQTASGTYEYLYDPNGRRTSRWNVSNNSGDEGRIYWDGNQIAFRSLDGTTYFENQDWLGTERMRTNYMGAKAMNYSSLPWGDGYAATTIQSGGTPDQDTLHYAQLDHDAESGTEHAQFRQLSSTQGRWMSPDPYDGSYDPFNPQSLNRYSYVLNNPLSFTDPSGQDIPDCSDDGCGDGGGYIGGSGYGSSPGEGDTPVSQGNVPTIQGPGTTIYLNPYISTGLIQGIGSAGGIQQVPSITFTGGGSAPKKKPGCSAGAFGNVLTTHLGSNALVSGSYTDSSAGVAVGSKIGSLFGPVGAFAGGVIGSMFGVGASISYVPSTGSVYFGGVVTAGAGLNGGSGINVSSINVPSYQDPNSIANGASYSATFQPFPVLGSTVTKSPGSGPPVVGGSVGTRSPVSGSAGFSICIRHCGC